ncbi:flagellar hook-length control protein FliK [Marinomonas atlantica]|uniref:flagellar hook-length control protein FliK n=1 Tax=Marinomonas atlantica TaxID=1806668 RepID=UPI00082A777E|nr:flagellar hook-length control protein FliK [Marinomonas atlantica]
MINSPSLSVVPTTPKVAKTSSLSQSNSGGDFGSVFDATNRLSSTERKPKTSPVSDDKVNKNQDLEESRVLMNEAPKKDSVEYHDTQSKPLEKEATLKDSDKKEKSDEGKAAYQEGVEVDTSKSSVVDEDGKERQIDGQAVAVDVSTQEANYQNTGSGNTSSVIQSPPETSAEQLSQDGEADTNISLEVKGESISSSERDSSILNKTEPALDDTASSEGKTFEKVSGTLEGESSSILAEEKVSGTLEGESSSVLAEEKVSGTLEGESSSVLAEEKVSGTLEGESSSILAAGKATGAAENISGTFDDATPVSDLGPRASFALNIEDTEGEAETLRPNENLRWMMEQLSKKTEQSTNGLSAAPNAMNVSNSTLSGESLAAALQDGDLSVLMDKDLIELPKDLSELIGAKKVLEQVESGFNSSLQPASQGLNSLSSVNALVGAGTSNVRPEGAAAQLTMHALPNTQAWSSEMTSKVSWVVKEGFKTAHIQLDPPELGSLTVKVSIDQDSNTHVSFVASSAHAKEALEGQMQRLRDMLQQQGMDLGSVDVEVSQDNGQAYGSDASDGQNGQGKGGGNPGNDDVGDMDGLENVSYVSPTEQGIDYYA